MQTASHSVPAGDFKSGLFASVVLAGTLLLSLNPNSHGPACLIRATTGVPCPGCGMTRSLSAIWRGDLLSSFRFHPLGIPLFLVCLSAILIVCLERLTPSCRPITARIRRAFMHVGSLTSIAVLLVVLWLVRLGMRSAGIDFFQW